jgi:hypothetical protein
VTTVHHAYGEERPRKCACSHRQFQPERRLFSKARHKGDRAECVLRVDLVIVREITFGIEVKYCYENNGSFISGAAIYTISEETWFDAFEEIFDFVVVRQGKSE